MIVICTRCQAKFKVAADKVGPRGAKVRCSKCQSVFVVQRDPGTIPAAAPPRSSRPAGDVELEPRTPSPSAVTAPRPARDASAGFASPDPFAAAPLRADPFATPVDDPFAVDPRRAAAAPSAGRPSSADPLAALGLGAPLAAQTSADPFAAARRGADPFATAPADADPFAAPADPFASLGDPFAATVTPRPDTPGLAVTDLSALVAAPGSAAPARAPAPTFEIAEPTPAPTAPAIEAGELDFSGDFDFASEPATGPALGGPFTDLALEDRTTPGPARGVRVAPAEPGALAGGGEALPAPDLAGGGAPAEVGFADPGEVSFFSDGDDGSLALATDAGPAPAPSPLAAAAAPERPARAPAATPPGAGAGATKAAKPDAPEAGTARLPGGRAGRLRAAAVNAVALVALLVVALAFRVVWRGEGSVGTGGLRPSAVLGALGKDDAFAPQGVRSGLYDRAKAPPVLFVRGEIVSRAAAAVRSIQVDVEIVRDGRVIARGAAVAGAVPTPEELHGTADAAALDALAAALRTRAPAEIRPGERVPFLVAIGDAPADLAGAAVRVAAVPEAAGR